MVYYKDRCFFLRFKEILSLQHNLLHRDEFAWNLFMFLLFWTAQVPWTWGFTVPIGKVNGALTGWQVEPQDSFV